MREPDGDARSRGPLRTIDVARRSRYSVQQVRDLERLGVIPPAARSGNGYRGYAPLHVQALGAYRGLATAVGPVAARELLVHLWAEPLTEAASAIGALHVRLTREREEALRAQDALHTILAEAEAPGSGRESDAMTITELAGALHVRASTLRFWEDEGLVHPERVTALRARRYGPRAVDAARVVAALRSSGHGIPAVREIMVSLDRHDGLEQAGRVLRRRLDQIAGRTVALLRAGADLAAVVTAADPGSAGPDAP